MSNGWFYNHRDGSVKSASEAEIEDLVYSGVLSPDSLLSKDGASDWIAANQFEELKPYFEKSIDSEDTSESALHIDQSIAASRAGLIDVLKGGVIYATNLVKRFKLRYWNLPPLYRNLGRTISISDPPRSEFPGLTDQLDRISAELDANESNSPARPAGIVPTIRWIAIKSISFMQLYWLYFQKSWCHWKLGESVYKSRLESSIPTSVTKPIAETHAKIDQTDEELERLSCVNKGDWITPRNSGLVLLFVIMIGLIRALAGFAMQTEKSISSSSDIARNEYKSNITATKVISDLEDRIPAQSERNRSNSSDKNKEKVLAESRNNTPIAGDTPKGDSNPELRNPNYAYGFNHFYIYGKARAMGFYKIPLYSRKYFENDIPEEVAKLKMEMMKAKQEFDDQRIPLREAIYQQAKGRFDGFLKGAADAGLELQDLDGIR